MLFSLQDPVLSLIVLSGVLEMFGKVYGYKINQGKLIILGFPVCQVLKDQVPKFSKDR